MIFMSIISLFPDFLHQHYEIIHSAISLPSFPSNTTFFLANKKCIRTLGSIFRVSVYWQFKISIPIKGDGFTARYLGHISIFVFYEGTWLPLRKLYYNTKVRAIVIFQSSKMILQERVFYSFSSIYLHKTLAWNNLQKKQPQNNIKYVEIV